VVLSSSKSNLGQENIPNLVFIACHDIPPMTELTLNYSPGKRKPQIPYVRDCFCGAAKCREVI